MLDLLNRLVKEEEGQGMVEYGLIIGVLAIALIAALGVFRTDITELFGRIGGDLDTVAP